MQIEGQGVLLDIDPTLLAQLKEKGAPLVLSVDGRAEVVLQDAASYQKLLDDTDERQALAGIRRGLADVEAGRVKPLEEFEREFRARHGIPRHSD
jgi:PHD/YefM family antitoxin component YafN of YafNO toxin-antitoxin module